MVRWWSGHYINHRWNNLPTKIFIPRGRWYADYFHDYVKIDTIWPKLMFQNLSCYCSHYTPTKFVGWVINVFRQRRETIKPSNARHHVAQNSIDLESQRNEHTEFEVYWKIICQRVENHHLITFLVNRESKLGTMTQDETFSAELTNKCTYQEWRWITE